MSTPSDKKRKGKVGDPKDDAGLPSVRKRTRPAPLPSVEAEPPAAEQKTDYKVGYCRPPAKHQFKKGQQRPPGSGRRNGSLNTWTLAQQALDARFPVTMNGKTKKVTLRELGIAHDQKKTAAGDWKAFERPRKLAGDIVEASPDSPATPATLSGGDRESCTRREEGSAER